MTETATAVLDRIVDGETAVLLVEADGDVVDELTVPVEELPEPGREEGAVFDVDAADGELRRVEHRPEETAERRRRAQDRFDRLSERLGEE